MAAQQQKPKSIPLLRIDFLDITANGCVFVHDERAKSVAIGDFVKCVDDAGQSCFGIAEMIDGRTSMLRIALDRSTHTTTPA